jgi:hypothetical protein
MAPLGSWGWQGLGPRWGGGQYRRRFPALPEDPEAGDNREDSGRWRGLGRPWPGGQRMGIGAFLRLVQRVPQLKRDIDMLRRRIEELEQRLAPSNRRSSAEGVHAPITTEESLSKRVVPRGGRGGARRSAQRQAREARE